MNKETKNCFNKTEDGSEQIIGLLTGHYSFRGHLTVQEVNRKSLSCIMRTWGFGSQLASITQTTETKFIWIWQTFTKGTRMLKCYHVKRIMSLELQYCLKTGKKWTRQKVPKKKNIYSIEGNNVLVRVVTKSFSAILMKSEINLPCLPPELTARSSV